MNTSKKHGLTPYQGKHKTFGYYHCDTCKYEWHSGNSWANTSQTCKKCMIDIYPYRQEKPEKNKIELNKNKNHNQDLCGKCRDLPKIYACSYKEPKSKRN
jgi:hypothetical protein